MKNTILFILVLIFSASLFANPNNEPYYHKVKPEQGDGAFSLLRKYKLLNHCNLDKFYELNKLNKDDVLSLDKEYYIPSLIYKYNRKSIRTTIAINDWKKAVKIKEYNEWLLQQKIRRTNYLESNILWVPYSELNCSNVTNMDEEQAQEESMADLSPKKPKPLRKTDKNIKANKPSTDNKYTTKTIVLPILGSKNKNVLIKSERLQGKVFYVVSGHGGPDPGAECTDCAHKLCEDEYAYDVSLRLVKNLVSHGATVHTIIQDDDGIREDHYLKCDTDEKCMGKFKLPGNQQLRLKQRTDAINDLFEEHKINGVKEQKVISLHIDSNTKSKKQDVFFCYYEQSKRSKSMAYDLKNTFAKKYAKFQKDKKYKGHVRAQNFYIIKNTLPPAILVELANIKNKENQKRFTIPSNRQALADWLFEGLTGIPK